MKLWFADRLYLHWHSATKLPRSFDHHRLFAGIFLHITAIDWWWLNRFGSLEVLSWFQRERRGGLELRYWTEMRKKKTNISLCEKKKVSQIPMMLIGFLWSKEKQELELWTLHTLVFCHRRRRTSDRTSYYKKHFAVFLQYEKYPAYFFLLHNFQKSWLLYHGIACCRY